MEMNYFDLIIAAVILLLGLKGILNGFFKELFGLIGIVGGIFIASRVGESVGLYLNDLVFHFESSAAVNFTGFLVTLVLFWLLMLLLGYGFKKLSALSGLGLVDRIFGFIFGASKFFFIAAVIAFSLNNIKALKDPLASAFEKSKLFPILVATGGYIMKMDPSSLSSDLNNSITKQTDSLTKSIEEKSKEIVDKKIKENIATIQEKFKEEK